MADIWFLDRSSQYGTQEWTVYTDDATIAAAQVAGALTGAPEGVRKGDRVTVYAGCTVGGTTEAHFHAARASRTIAATKSGEGRASVDAPTGGGTVDLTDIVTFGTDTD